jgi:hypothetical protein
MRNTLSRRKEYATGNTESKVPYTKRWTLRKIVNADLTGYFDTISQPKLMKSLVRSIADGKLQFLFKLWLVAQAIEIDKESGQKTKLAVNWI